MRRYSNFIAPHGTNLRSERNLPLDVVSHALIETVRFLRNIGLRGARLIRYDDWWEHDGLHFNRPDGDIDFEALSLIVETSGAIRTSMDGTEDVYIGIAPTDFLWYLRFYQVPISPYEPATVPWTGEGPFGRFDVTLLDALAATYRQQVLVPLKIAAQEQEAIDYFLSIGMDSYILDPRFAKPSRNDY